jgi:hypothetical protein
MIASINKSLAWLGATGPQGTHGSGIVDTQQAGSWSVSESTVAVLEYPVRIQQVQNPAEGLRMQSSGLRQRRCRGRIVAECVRDATFGDELQAPR